MNRYLFMLVSLLCIQSVFALDASEKGVPTSPLTIWSAGIGAGAVMSLNDELRAQSEQFLKISFLNNIFISDNVNLFLDLNWFGRGENFGADGGIDFLPLTGKFRPFIGIGAGAHHFAKKGYDFGQNIGPSMTAHIGGMLEVSERLHMQVRLPVYLVGNSTRDRLAGVEIGMLFSAPYRNVKKLHY
jgi:hypothetical protein